MDLHLLLNPEKDDSCAVEPARGIYSAVDTATSNVDHETEPSDAGPGSQEGTPSPSILPCPVSKVPSVEDHWREIAHNYGPTDLRETTAASSVDFPAEENAVRTSSGANTQERFEFLLDKAPYVCTECRASRRKCDFSSGRSSCDRCEKKHLSCVVLPAGNIMRKRRLSRLGDREADDSQRLCRRPSMSRNHVAPHFPKEDCPKDHEDIQRQTIDLLKNEGLTDSSYSEICEHKLFKLSDGAPREIFSKWTKIFSALERPFSEESWWSIIFQPKLEQHVNDASEHKAAILQILQNHRDQFSLYNLWESLESLKIADQEKREIKILLSLSEMVSEGRISITPSLSAGYLLSQEGLGADQESRRRSCKYCSRIFNKPSDRTRHERGPCPRKATCESTTALADFTGASVDRFTWISWRN